jgi:phosphate transport system substrate-binding protein
MMKKNLLVLFVFLGLIGLVMTGCPAGQKQPAELHTPGSPKPPQQESFTPVDRTGITLDGAGASFPAPIYAQWGYSYEELSHLKVNYQSVGSGAGIAAIQAKTVIFGASDAPMTKHELDQNGLVQFPMVIGGVVPVVNVPGIQSGAMKLSGDVLARIYLGTIQKWNDPAIAGINAGLSLPNIPIVVAHRADGSGTTWIFTSYLDTVSPDWHSKVGAGKSVQWPVGVGGRGNEGVSSNVQQVAGAIGYVEYAYAVQNQLTYAMLQNKAGNFVAPSIESFTAAAANADWANAPGFYMVLVDQPGEQSWPITGASFILIYREQEDLNKARAMFEFFDWCFRYGGDQAKAMAYVPIPPSLVTLVENTWRDQITSNGQKVWERQA